MLTNLLYRLRLAPLAFALGFGLTGCPAQGTCTYSPQNGGTCNDPDAGGNNLLCYAGNNLITTVCAPELPTLSPITWCRQQCEADGLSDCTSINRALNDCDCVKCTPSAPPPPEPSSGFTEYLCQWPTSTPPTYNVKTGLDEGGEPIWSPGELTSFYSICVIQELKPMATEKCKEAFWTDVGLKGGYIAAGEEPAEYPNKLPNDTMIESLEVGPCPLGAPYTPVTSNVFATVMLTQDQSTTAMRAEGQMVYGIPSFVGGASAVLVEGLQLSTPGPYMVAGEELSNVTIKLLSRLTGPLDSTTSSVTIPAGSVELMLEADAIAADGSSKRYLTRFISPDIVTLAVDRVGNALMNARFPVSPTETLTVSLSGVPQGP